MDTSYDCTLSQTSSTQVVSGSISVPVGHIVVAAAWRNTELTQIMARSISVVYCEGNVVLTMLLQFYHYVS